jgi:hypothetical protein
MRHHHWLVCVSALPLFACGGSPDAAEEPTASADESALDNTTAIKTKRDLAYDCAGSSGKGKAWLVEQGVCPRSGASADTPEEPDGVEKGSCGTSTFIISRPGGIPLPAGYADMTATLTSQHRIVGVDWQVVWENLTLKHHGHYGDAYQGAKLHRTWSNYRTVDTGAGEVVGGLTGGLWVLPTVSDWSVHCKILEPTDKKLIP